MLARAVNLRTEAHDVFVGRQHGAHHFGNPFSHQGGTLATIRVGSRDEAVERYLGWVLQVADLEVEPERRAWIRTNLHHLRGARLGCFCKPLTCHGDVLAWIVNTIYEPDDLLTEALRALCW